MSMMCRWLASLMLNESADWPPGEIRLCEKSHERWRQFALRFTIDRHIDKQKAAGAGMLDLVEQTSARGSIWHRWDPHIHAPGTALNDQYAGPDPWGDFCAKVTQSNPPIRALGITDYCGIDCYVETVERLRAGKLPGVVLVFPNVEFRLSIETRKGAAVNLHLLFSPEDHDHVERIGHFLGGLQFKHQGETFRCTRSDLIRLGRAHDSSLVDDKAAYSEGVNQFKVSLDELRAVWQESKWAQENCLVAVAGGGRDGTSGLQTDDGQWAATRQNIVSFAHIIFTANPKQIEFFLGRGKATPEDLEARWGGRKPCLHGSDAHEADRVGAPDQGRRCWVKGDLTFEALRQAVIEPEGRVFIGELPPRGAMPGNSMRHVEVTNAPWMRPTCVPLNAGMVAIVGARGSGKTALADLIATGAFGVSSQLSKSSFLRRAAEFLTQSDVRITWENDEFTENQVASVDAEDLLDAPHVQYLSQQFVEQLCSSEGLDDALVAEIQRVIFDAHPEADRMGAETFQEFLSLRMEQARDARDRHRRQLERATEAITAEQLRKDGLAALIKDRDEKKKAIEKDKADRKLLVPKGQEARAKRLEEITSALEQKQRVIGAVRLKIQALEGIQNDVQDFRLNQVSEWLADMQERRMDAGLSATDWKSFGVQFLGDVDGLLKERVRVAKIELGKLVGEVHDIPAGETEGDANVALIEQDADLSQLPLTVLERERNRLQKLAGVDEQNSRRFKLLTDKITKAETALAKVLADIERAGKADEVLRTLRAQRSDAYRNIFDAVIDEEMELANLYAPLGERIANGPGSVAKLSFSIRRVVDIGAWAERGEALLDLRTGPFRGKGELRKVASAALERLWRTGGSEEVSVAVAKFIADHSEQLKLHMPAQTNFRTWAREIAAWLYSTDHVQVSYGLQYDGVDIERLSPGTRGVVLLLLYLAIDSEDDRPLIIDQPEENLDPQSVYDELVPVFREARKRRQVIIVTHNANLVVNTDVDQVIVARSGAHRPGQLPDIDYESGGLENKAIRSAVCAILEGGARAFRERARRLRVQMS
jgi:ABC-type lipoprotein export system ATPase subunit